MATTTENVYIKLQVDTRSFDGSMTGIKREMASLRGLIGNSLLSKQENDALTQRLGELKNNLDDVKIAANNIDVGDVFGNTARFASVAASAVAGVTGAMSLLGLESEKAGEVEKKILQFMAIGNALQQVADAKRLTNLAAIYGQRIKEFILGKQILEQEIALSGAEVGGGGGGGATVVKDTSAIATANAAANIKQAASMQKLGESVAIATSEEALLNAQINTQNALLAKNSIAMKETAEELLFLEGLQEQTNDQKIRFNDLIQKEDGLKLESNALNAKKAQLEESLLEITNKRTAAVNVSTIAERNNNLIKDANSVSTVKAAFAQGGFVVGVKAATAAVINFTKSLLMNPITWFVLAIGAAVAAIYLLVKAFESEESKLAKMNKALEKTTEYLKKMDDEIKSIQTSTRAMADQLDVSLGRMEARAARAKDIIRKYFSDIFNDEVDYFAQQAELTKIYEKGDIDLETYWRKQGEITDRYVKLTEAKALAKNIALVQLDVDANNEKLEKAKEYQKELDRIQEEELKRLWAREYAIKQFRDKASKDEIKLIKQRRQTEYIELFDINRLYSENELKYSKDILDRNLDAEENFYLRKIDLIKQDIRNKKAANQDILEAEKLLVDTQIQLMYLRMTEIEKWKFEWDTIFNTDDLGLKIQKVTELIATTMGYVSEFINTSISAQQEALSIQTEDALNRNQKALEDTIKGLDSAYKYGVISLENYNKQRLDAELLAAKKEKELKTYQAEKEKEWNIAKAIMSAAQSVLSALATAPPMSYILAALNASLGAYQVATIKNTPIPTFAMGGYINGQSHSQGGTMINAEAGEFIVNKRSAQSPNIRPVLESINAGTYQGMDMGNLEKIIKDTILSVSSIPVINVESETTRVQRRVTNIEANARW